MGYKEQSERAKANIVYYLAEALWERNESLLQRELAARVRLSPAQISRYVARLVSGPFPWLKRTEGSRAYTLADAETTLDSLEARALFVAERLAERGDRGHFSLADWRNSCLDDDMRLTPKEFDAFIERYVGAGYLEPVSRDRAKLRKRAIGNDRFYLRRVRVGNLRREEDLPSRRGFF